MFGIFVSNGSIIIITTISFLSNFTTLKPCFITVSVSVVHLRHRSFCDQASIRIKRSITLDSEWIHSSFAFVLFPALKIALG